MQVKRAEYSSKFPCMTISMVCSAQSRLGIFRRHCGRSKKKTVLEGFRKSSFFGRSFLGVKQSGWWS